ncbi:MAG TPA: fatty acid desaturase, partial [Alphaproteobacteria bacterium]|nr:fatty acid desaturase [Alphaproteobacteria bacterium]
MPSERADLRRPRGPAAAGAGPTPRRQGLIGLGLAALIVGGWLALHIWGVFLHRWSAADWLVVPLAVGVQTWLCVGLFIVGHDAIHGSLVPGRPRWNAAIGQLCFGLYAVFSLRKLAAGHHAHHAAPGTADDPDFDADHPRAFVPWFVAFFRRYFGLAEFARLAALLAAYLFVLGAPPLNAAVFWGLPAILSALQLFTFGTYLPHRHEEADFADHHRARTL